MYIRGRNSIAESFSYDKGKTWTIPHENRQLFVPNSHFYCAKLRSGNVLFLLNRPADMYSFYEGRNHLTAMISRDDGRTWEGFLTIDEREGSEQPDFFETENGTIYISYGRAPQIAGETLMAVVTEEDVFAGKLVNPNSRLRILVGKATGIKNGPHYKELEKIAREYKIEM